MAHLRPATAMDRAPVTTLLSRADLPTAGLADLAELWVLEENRRVVGAIGYERHDGVALLRSLVVDPKLRGRGHGRELLELGSERLRSAGVRDAYGLTTTIPDLLARSGWRELPRAELPAALGASAELRGACPDSARAFHLPLGAGP